MVSKNMFPIFHIFLFFSMLTILMPSLSFAQETAIEVTDYTIADDLPTAQEKKAYYMKETTEGLVFVQTLTWDEVAYILRYDVVIEKQSENGQWDLFNTISTELNTLEVSLFAGTYRYKVLVYNIFDMLEIESEWFDFTIFRATQPQIASFSPKAMYLEEINTGIFTIKGENLLEDTIYTLESTEVLERILTGVIVKKDDKNKEIDVQFDIDAIDIGNYTLLLKNPGGLIAEDDFSVVQFFKTYNFTITAGYSATFTPPNGDISRYFDTLFFPVGFNVQFTYIPVKNRFGYFGVELAGKWIQIAQKIGGFDITSNIFPVHVNFVYQMLLIKARLFLDTHIGIGLTFFHDLQFNFGMRGLSPILNAIGFSANAGAALQIYMTKRLYAEIGLDYILTIPNKRMFQMILPSVSVGWQF